MAKRVEATEPKGSQSSSVAIKPKPYADLIKAVAVANEKMDTGRNNKAELIRNAVDSDNLHSGAFSWIMKLRKMDPVKRNEFLFHFDVYCEREKFAREDLLPDRAEAGAAAAGGDDDEDLRPRHLKQPGASVTSAVDQIKEDALSKVGRGPEPKPSTSH